ncbi:MAG: RNA-binding protein [Candidatus Dojkabacteria bacterium]|uniref:RNA recognition motif n=2 Tax=Candidatus Dojkabacteria TaxID=74243 RepID=A0A136KKU0_9BACT|nr:MAG: RNA recognition motif [candidate division WS6 bacterium OLB21]MBW7953578.1 RNA-binding protein [Candidatus Dojkabacteria bacterium]WKZ27854.1 MAG: RNA-binding protein [Candidatus Dojkabacteria bacterium]
MNSKLFVGNLSWNVDNEMLREAFSAVGTVVEAVVIVDKFKNRSKGFGFVTMSSAAEAEAAVAELNGKEVDGRPIRVSIAEERKDRGPRNNNRGNDGFSLEG